MLFFIRPINRKRPLEKGDIVVAGFLGTNIGLGEGARRIIKELKNANLIIHTANLSAILGNEDFNAGEKWPRSTKDHGILIFYVNPDYFSLFFFILNRKKLISRRIIAYWHWELETIPKKWLDTLQLVDEIWVPTFFIANALKKVTDQTPIYVIPHSYDISNTPIIFSKDPFPEFFGKTLVFFMYDIGSCHARKNPEAIIKAFSYINDPNVILIIKIKNASAWPESLEKIKNASNNNRNIHIMQDNLSSEQMRNLIARMDIIISLHRSEGYGLLMLEGMAAGKPVIATGWSGNLDFMTPECSILIDYTLVPVKDEQGIYDKYNAVWAEPNIEQAAKALQFLIDHPEERVRLGQAARAHIEKICSNEAWIKHLPQSFWDSLS